MDNNHNIIVTANGQYEYDPDSDVYRRVLDRPVTHAERWGWLYVCAVLTVVCWIAV